MTKTKRLSLWGVGGAILAVAGLAAVVGIGAWRTEAGLEDHRDRVADLGHALPPPRWDTAAVAHLPDPVQAYLRFALPVAAADPSTPPPAVLRYRMKGDFRRPLQTAFAPATAEQVIATGTPALMFSARTPVGPGLWVRFWDAFAEGQMHMEARVLSLITMMEQPGSEALKRSSIRRWLLESPMDPMALLPGGPVRWEAIDADHARAVVSAGGLEASLVATFAPDGALIRFEAEEDGDLDTPYHGSGEWAERGDYRLVDGVRVPFAFTIARAADGEVYPFWQGRVTEVAFE